MAHKRVVVALPTTEFDELTSVAEYETRTADQQATHFVRQSLRATVSRELQRAAWESFWRWLLSEPPSDPARNEPAVRDAADGTRAPGEADGEVGDVGSH